MGHGDPAIPGVVMAPNVQVKPEAIRHRQVRPEKSSLGPIHIYSVTPATFR